jgi:hypothetical protein
MAIMLLQFLSFAKDLFIMRAQPLSAGLYALSLAVLSSLVMELVPAPASAQTYTPPSGIGLPGRREGGGTRGDCLSAARQLTAIAPAENFGYTTDEFPTWYWFVPELTDQVAEFILYDETGETVYATAFDIAGDAGVVSLSLPAYANLPPLEVGERYRWQFSLVCESERSAPSITFVEGWTERIEPDAALANQLATASPVEQATLYAENGIWFDAVDTLAELRRESPRAANQAWQTLLESVDLGAIATEPLQPCCDNMNQSDMNQSNPTGEAEEASPAVETSTPANSMPPINPRVSPGVPGRSLPSGNR